MTLGDGGPFDIAGRSIVVHEKVSSQSSKITVDRMDQIAIKTPNPNCLLFVKVDQ